MVVCEECHFCYILFLDYYFPKLQALQFFYVLSKFEGYTE